MLQTLGRTQTLTDLQVVLVFLILRGLPGIPNDLAIGFLGIAVGRTNRLGLKDPNAVFEHVLQGGAPRFGQDRVAFEHREHGLESFRRQGRIARGQAVQFAESGAEVRLHLLDRHLFSLPGLVEEISSTRRR